jgi:hypothetical protein
MKSIRFAPEVALVSYDYGILRYVHAQEARRIHAAGQGFIPERQLGRKRRSLLPWRNKLFA